jgi:hypothetical protein
MDDLIVTDDDLTFVARYAHGHQSYEVSSFYAENIDKMLNPYKEKGLIYYNISREGYYNQYTREVEVVSYIDVLLTEKGHRMVLEHVKSQIDKENQED